MGYPVVLKAADPDLVHKSDIGAVRLNLTDPASVSTAFQVIATALGQPEAPVLVQSMADPGLELVAGVVHDPVFGSVVMLGLGGVHTEISRIGAATPPVTDTDAARCGGHCAPPWTATAANPGRHRGRGGPRDAPGSAGRGPAGLAELDLNPVLVGPTGLVAVDVKLRLAPVGFEPDAALRTLRQP
jgi:hypothetical protein